MQKARKQKVVAPAGAQTLSIEDVALLGVKCPQCASDLNGVENDRCPGCQIELMVFAAMRADRSVAFWTFLFIIGLPFLASSGMLMAGVVDLVYSGDHDWLKGSANLLVCQGFFPAMWWLMRPNIQQTTIARAAAWGCGFAALSAACLLVQLLRLP